MVEPSVLGLFVVTCAVAVVAPGPDTLLVLGNTLGGGRKRGLVTALGVCSGFLVHITAAVLGLSAVVLASATLFTLVKLGGAAYLIYLGLRAWQGAARFLWTRGRKTPTQALLRRVLWATSSTPR